MGIKSSKSNVVEVQPLSKQEIAVLCKDTGFSEDELLNWHANFYQDCPDGRLTFKQFENEYSKIMGKPNEKTIDYIKHMFNVYDQDKNQVIDFKEFVMAISAASAVNRLRLIETLFHVFDLDNDGKITKEEISKMLGTLVDVTDSNNKHDSDNNANHQGKSKAAILQQRIDEAFNELNANDDDHITKDEFIDWYSNSGLLSDVQAEEFRVQEPFGLQKPGKKSQKHSKNRSLIRSHPEQDENQDRNQHAPRHISKMIERRQVIHTDDVSTDNNIATTQNRASGDIVTSYHGQNLRKQQSYPVTTASHMEAQPTRENERWQHLVNSVLGQVRAQRAKDQSLATNIPTNAVTTTDTERSWKSEGVERARVQFTKRKPAGTPNPTYASNESLEMSAPRTAIPNRPPSPEILTMRF